LSGAPRVLAASKASTIMRISARRLLWAWVQPDVSASLKKKKIVVGGGG
jgi:hypothetical protein